MKTTALISVAALIALASQGTAPALAEATQAQRAACTPDVFRLCASEIPNVEGIKACLRREAARLTPGCRTVMEAADKGVKTASAR